LINLSPISLGGFSLLFLSMALDLRFNIFLDRGYIFLGWLFFVALVIFVPMIKNLRKESQNGHN